MNSDRSTAGLQSPRIALRGVHESDLRQFFEDQCEPEGAALAAFTPREEAEFFAHWAKILANPTSLNRTILCDARIAGNIVSFEQDGHREVGYWITRGLWGRGVASEALRQFLLEETRRPLLAFVAEHNRGSVRVLEKCGFRIVGKQEHFALRGDQSITGVILRLE